MHAFCMVLFPIFCLAIVSYVQCSKYVYWQVYITKTCLYYFEPLKPHFYIVKLGFTRVYIIFLISAHNIDCRYLLEPPRRGGSNEYPQSMFWTEIWKISAVFCLKIFIFLVVKFSVYLNRRVFVMGRWMLTFVQCTFITGLIQGQGKAGSYGKYFDTRYFQVYML